METKICSKCGEEYPATREYFCLDRRKKSGLGARCKKCENIRSEIYRKKNPEEYRKHMREYGKKYDKKYYQTLRGYISRVVKNIKTRCTNSNNPNYRYYGERGIKCLFNSIELFDWIVINNIEPRGRDIHRINNDGNYTLDNITFMDKGLHSSLHRSLEKQERL